MKTSTLIIWILLAPFGIIWSVNTLFGTAIPITASTYSAAVILSLLLSGSGR